MDKKGEFPPFRPHKEYSSGGDRQRLLQLGEDPSVVFREIPDAIIMKSIGGRIANVSGNFKNAERRELRVKTLLQELEAYDIHTATRFEIISIDGIAALYGKVENIRETPLTNAHEQMSYLSELRTLLENLIRYYDHKKNALGYFLSDITRRDQYAYGKKAGDAANHLYLIDPDFYHSDDPEVYEAAVRQLLQWVEAVESSFTSSAVDMTEQKNRCRRLLAQD